MRIVVVDIGGTAIKSGVFDKGKVRQIKEEKTEAKRGAKAVFETVEAMIESYQSVDAIGICTTGQIDVEKGRVCFAGPNIPDYQGFEIKKTLVERFHVPVAVENDVNAAALGEAYFGAGVVVNDFLCLTYGTGIGGAIIQNKQLYRGKNFAAGEFGGLIIHPENRNQNNDDIFSGCYERYASVTALVHAARKVDASIQNGRDVWEKRNSLFVKEVLADWIQEISIGLVSLIHIFDPELVLLGGGMMEQSELILRIEEKIKEMIMDRYKGVQITSAQLGNLAGLYGMVRILQ
ncbi:MAG: ROK family protein [Velocimicrobium sp.]